MKKMIVLLDARSRPRLGGGRLAGLQRSEVVWERPPRIGRRARATAPDEEDSLLKYNVQGYMRSARAHAQTHTHTLSQSASIEALGEFLLETPTHDGGERKGGGRGLVGDETMAGDQSSIASSWSAKSSNMLPMSSKMETVAFLLERELESEKKKEEI